VQSKKIINDPRKVVQESIEGLVDAYGGYIRKLGDLNALVKVNLRKDKVGLLIGGGSAHEPLFPAFIGENLGDGAACGNVFAAPTPDTILEATRALNQGNGEFYSCMATAQETT
jgi:phosphoenolpyruvate---glycerone phosphotransferase subunit DhaK